MNRGQTTFPLFNRIVVLVLSSAMVLGIPILVVKQIRKGDGLDVVSGLLLLVFFGVGCALMWFSLFWRHRAEKELAEEESFPSAERPQIPEDALVYRFDNGMKSAAIFVDRGGQMFHFHNCHAPRRFLSTASKWFSCPLNEIQAAHVLRYRGESLTVVTKSGKALINSARPGYEELRDTIKELVPVARQGFSTDHPMMGMVYLFGALVGLFAGVMVTPRHANDATLGLFLLVGAVLGVAGSYLLVWGPDRSLKTSLVQPIGFSVLGAATGLAIANFIAPWVGWDLLPMAALVAVGVVFGGMFGIKKQSRERGSFQSNDVAASE
jgi:hypothetical protein